MLKMMYVWTDEYEKKNKEFEGRINKYSEKLVRLDTVDLVNNYKYR